MRNIHVFAGRFGSILRESDIQTDLKYIGWFELNFHIFAIKSKLNQTDKQRVGLSWINQIHYKEMFKNILKKI